MIIRCCDLCHLRIETAGFKLSDVGDLDFIRLPPMPAVPIGDDALTRVIVQHPKFGNQCFDICRRCRERMAAFIAGIESREF